MSGSLNSKVRGKQIITQRTKNAAAAFRTVVKQLRVDYNTARADYLFRNKQSDYSAHTLMVSAQCKLQVLVPFLRSLDALAQKNKDHIISYTGKYNRLVEVINEVLNSNVGGPFKIERYFGGIEHLEIPIPNMATRSEEWEWLTFEQLIQRCFDAISKKKRDELSKARKAEKLRKQFLESLSDGQRIMLTQALDAARANNRHAVMFDIRDFA